MKQLPLILFAVAIIYFVSQSFINSGPQTKNGQSKIEALLFFNQTHDKSENFTKVLAQMNKGEIDDMYNAIFNYFIANKQIPKGDPLRTRMNLISAKYNIFT